MSKNKKRALFLSALFVFVVTTAALVIKIAQGYLPDLNNLSFRPNGLLVATSNPDGAQLLINGKIVSATNTTLNLSPDEYEVEIKKDGFATWKKNLPVKKELVTKIEAYLFPTFPSLTPLTFTGASGPVISPDGQKVVFSVGQFSADKNGLWVLDLTDRPLGFSREAKQIVKSAPKGRDFADSTYIWSPDSKQILVTLKNRPGLKIGQTIEENFLLEAGELNPDVGLVDVTQDLTALKNRWQEENILREKAQADKLPKKLLTVLKESVKEIVFSPDETKIFYTATASASLPENIIPSLPTTSYQPETRNLQPGKVYTYDLKEDKNFYLIDEPKEVTEQNDQNAKAKSKSTSEKATDLPANQLFASATKAISWFPTSRHLFYVQESKITILEYDNANWIDVYTGPFEDNFAFPFPTGNKALVLATLGSDTPSNLYAISLR